MVVVKIRTVLLSMMIGLSRQLPNRVQPADKQFKQLSRASKSGVPK
uniref:Uncharacterized protein n=1 Tax=Coprothermobacter proteolyticus (strain ATCC 35245 / DSM 5265 / OCM 4 / BT) TaxID=309798 RepID=B5Y9B3_COPPD